jgi:AmiR/NasT family two-component response regulator
MRLDPYVVVIGTRDRASQSVIVLRAGGYQVTKLPDSELAAKEAALLRPDAIVLDLPPPQANRLSQQLLALSPSMLLLTVTSAPSLVQTPVLPRSEVDMSLISTVDRMLANAA